MLVKSLSSGLFGCGFSLLFVLPLSPTAVAQRTRTGGPPRPLPLVSVPSTDKGQDGLIGSVRRVRTERAELSAKDGKLTEGPRFVLNTTVYNLQGKRIDNLNNVMNESHRGKKQEYKYDNRGNVTEMILRDKTGKVLSREVYTYEFDEVGNWVKMVTSTGVFEGGKSTQEPVAATYRTIAYYFDEATVKAQRNAALKRSASNSANGEKVAARASELNEGGARSNRTTKSKSTTQPPTKLNSGPTSARPASATAKANSSSPNGKPEPILFSVKTSNFKPFIPDAVYPEDAKRAGVMGTVAVLVELDSTGQVVSARATSGPSRLRASAVEAARKARLTPAYSAGKRSQVISFTFALL
jgi:TonB family protein